MSGHRQQEPVWTSVRGAGVRAGSPAKRGRSALTPVSTRARCSSDDAGGTTTSCGRRNSNIRRILELANRDRPCGTSRCPRAASAGSRAPPGEPSRCVGVGATDLLTRCLVPRAQHAPRSDLREVAVLQRDPLEAGLPPLQHVREPELQRPSHRGRLPPHPRRQRRQQRLHAALVVVRVAGCRRDLGDAVRALFGNLPSRPTSCMIPRSWTGAMPAMRRRAGRSRHSLARTLPCPRAGRWPMLKRQGIGICTLCAPYASRRYGSRTRCVLVNI